jgi:ankyrin repeat protein
MKNLIFLSLLLDYFAYATMTAQDFKASLKFMSPSLKESTLNNTKTSAVIRTKLTQCKLTQLFAAIDSFNTTMVKDIVSQDPKNLLVVKQNNRTALHHAIIRKNVNAVVTLLDATPAFLRNTVLNELDDAGNTPLMLAVYPPQDAIARKLLSYKETCIDKQNDAGLTALMFAATAHNNTSMVELLLDHCADIMLENNNKQKAVDLATDKVKILLETVTACFAPAPC